MKAVEVVAVAGKTVLENGKVDPSTIAVLFTKLDVFVKAVEDTEQISAEVKDLDGKDAKLILDQIITIVSPIKAA